MSTCIGSTGSERTSLVDRKAVLRRSCESVLGGLARVENRREEGREG